MKAALSSVVLAALLGFVNAKVELTNSDYNNIAAGSVFTITWDDAEGPVTLTLKNGPKDDLRTVQTITTTGSGGEYQWAVDQALPAGQYALEISDGTDVNYSKQFPIASTVEPSSSSESTSATVTRTTTASSETSSSETTSSETTSSETTSSETTSAETTTTKSSSSSAETTVTSASSVSRTTSSTPTPTESDAAETTVPNSNSNHNDARSMVAPVVPGLLAILGAAIL